MLLKKMLKRIPAVKGVLAERDELLAKSLALDTELAALRSRRLGKFDLARTRDGHMLTLTSDKVIGESLRSTGSFAEGDIDAALTLLSDAGRAPVARSVFLDVGANIGTHSIHALKIGFTRAICLEPDPDNFMLLRVNQILNGVDHRCVNWMVAASSESGTAPLEISPCNAGDHRVKLGSTSSVNTHDEQDWACREIVTRCLDEVLEEAGISTSEIGLAWIDTQGHEGHVFGGATKLLQSAIPVVAEFWPYGLSRSGGWSKMRDALTASGRTVYELRRSICQKKLQPISIDELDLLFKEMLAGESKQGSPHTDLLII